MAEQSASFASEDDWEEGGNGQGGAQGSSPSENDYLLFDYESLASDAILSSSEGSQSPDSSSGEAASACSSGGAVRRYKYRLLDKIPDTKGVGQAKRAELTRDWIRDTNSALEEIYLTLKPPGQGSPAAEFDYDAWSRQLMDREVEYFFTHFVSGSATVAAEMLIGGRNTYELCRLGTHVYDGTTNTMSRLAVPSPCGLKRDTNEIFFRRKLGADMSTNKKFYIMPHLTERVLDLVDRPDNHLISPEDARTLHADSSRRSEHMINVRFHHLGQSGKRPKPAVAAGGGMEGEVVRPSKRARHQQFATAGVLVPFAIAVACLCCSVVFDDEQDLRSRKQAVDDDTILRWSWQQVVPLWWLLSELLLVMLFVVLRVKAFERQARIALMCVISVFVSRMLFVACKHHCYGMLLLRGRPSAAASAPLISSNYRSHFLRSGGTSNQKLMFIERGVSFEDLKWLIGFVTKADEVSPINSTTLPLRPCTTVDNIYGVGVVVNITGPSHHCNVGNTSSTLDPSEITAYTEVSRAMKVRPNMCSNDVRMCSPFSGSC